MEMLHYCNINITLYRLFWTFEAFVWFLNSTHGQDELLLRGRRATNDLSRDRVLHNSTVCLMCSQGDVNVAKIEGAVAAVHNRLNYGNGATWCSLHSLWCRSGPVMRSCDSDVPCKLHPTRPNCIFAAKL